MRLGVLQSLKPLSVPMDWNFCTACHLILILEVPGNLSTAIDWLRAGFLRRIYLFALSLCT